ncbi:hypothetical protein J6590_083469 [Homalodisca vitripennis]|nr:hypothetical protein J6590_083469 [Homalodisca vitripennis]
MPKARGEIPTKSQDYSHLTIRGKPLSPLGSPFPICWPALDVVMTICHRHDNVTSAMRPHVLSPAVCCPPLLDKYVFPILSDGQYSDSDHESDINSNTEEVFEQELVDELGDISDIFDCVNSDRHLDNAAECLIQQPNESIEDDVLTDNQDEGDQVQDEEQAEVGGGSDQQDEGDEEKDEDGWREWTANDVSFDQFTYTNTPGFKPPTGSMPTTEMEYFQLFFTDELLTDIMNETNRYAREKIL